MLVGISLGPGDPELMTFKAAAALQSCLKVFVPGELAARLAAPYCQPEVLEFPMIQDRDELERIWTANAEIVAGYALRGEAGFACIGDVNTFSTFGHLARALQKRHPQIEVATIPGVGVVPAMASRFGISLDKSFSVSDGSEVESIIRTKATRPRWLAQELRKKGFSEFILGVKLCTPEETIIRGEMPENSDYFSVLYARRRN
jgi:precorrin-2/cobalt-factor-2 C20-methyltransferase